MNKLYALVVFSLCFYVFLHSRWGRSFRQGWRGKDPRFHKEKPTMFDVRQLLINGEKDRAIQVYCEIFKTNPQEARQAVEEIERSIQPKDF